MYNGVVAADDGGGGKLLDVRRFLKPVSVNTTEEVRTEWHLLIGGACNHLILIPGHVGEVVGISTRLSVSQCVADTVVLTRSYSKWHAIFRGECSILITTNMDCGIE